LPIDGTTNPVASPLSLAGATRVAVVLVEVEMAEIASAAEAPQKSTRG
jgi:hypothetical protein